MRYLFVDKTLQRPSCELYIAKLTVEFSRVSHIALPTTTSVSLPLPPIAFDICKKFLPLALTRDLIDIQAGRDAPSGKSRGKHNGDTNWSATNRCRRSFLIGRKQRQMRNAARYAKASNEVRCENFSVETKVRDIDRQTVCQFEWMLWRKLILFIYKTWLVVLFLIFVSINFSVNGLNNIIRMCFKIVIVSFFQRNWNNPK